ncbi:hypothetical protein [Bradyrhizobium japonicum]|uniref:hypothetical protein n=1 Tax=Bradyrhizobium japonicum TaxID=375 RepID=UPI001B8A4B63|nr:hypothetical protein [Bradyrhizobium japonicum]MBR0974107.1 hypothetical protein [Bradyrhizobium japonicum]
MANKRVWTRSRRQQAEMRELERLCLEWADDADLVLAREGLSALAANYRAAADAIASSAMSC